jgi:hypothetical protein
MSLDQLVEWSIGKIHDFTIGYNDVAIALGLDGTGLTFVTDLRTSHEAFVHWESCLRASAIKRGSTWALLESGVSFRSHVGSSSESVDLEFGLDPSGKRWAVQINEPPIPGDLNRLSGIAIDKNGAHFLLRQGWLRANPQHPTDIKSEEFVRLTGLRPASIAATEAAVQRQWFIVAPLDDDPDTIRDKTTNFVQRCWAARTCPFSESTVSQSPFDEQSASAENGGTYTIRAKSASDEKVVLRRHGIIWLSLTYILSSHNIPYAKFQHSCGYEIDLVVHRSGRSPLELKTETTAADLYTAIGQLYLYRQLFPKLRECTPILLVPNGIQEDIRSAIENCGIQVHTYDFVSDGIDGLAEFSKNFLAVCGIHKFTNRAQSSK